MAKRAYIDEPYSTPERAAEIVQSNPRPEKLRRQFVQQIAQNNPPTATITKLQQLMDRKINSHETLSLVGYENLRLLQAEGITLAEAAKDLDISLLDLMTFMALHPLAEEHAELDALACADAKMRDYIHELKNTKFLTKFDADQHKLKMDATLALTKRLSSKWAGLAQKINDANIGSAVGVNINIDLSGDLSDMPTRTADRGHDVIDVTPEMSLVHDDSYVDPLAVTIDEIEVPE